MPIKSHIALAHSYWEELVLPGDTVIDATCGNGHDTLFLAQIALTPTSGTLYAMDTQEAAIEKSRQHLSAVLSKKFMDKVHFNHGCHSRFPEEIPPNSVRLIVYNLGYLPGGDKSLTTMKETTLRSISEAENLVMDGGMISITCYPGHAAGKAEEEAVIRYSESLDKQLWKVCHHRWCNRKTAPSLLLIEKQPPHT